MGAITNLKHHSEIAVRLSVSM